MSRVTKVLAGVFLLAALYCGLDPFGRGIMADFPGFEVHRIDLSLPSRLLEVADPEDRLQRSEIRFLNQVQGPESIAFDPQGRGPYTGVADGRVLFWNGEEWTDFAYTSSNRSEICDPKPSPLSYLKVEHICGRPLGLRFHKKTGDLYIADAYFGLLKVGPEGGLATTLSTEAGGVPLKFTNDLDIDEEGNVYFTDSSSKYQRRNFMQISVTGDHSGRLLKFNPITNETSVLRGNLQFPNGVTLSKDGSFLLFCEGSRGRLHRYWLKGENAGTFDVFAILPGYPDNVRTNEKGEFWLAIHSRFTKYAIFMSEHPEIRKFVLKHPILARRNKLQAMILKYSQEGEILDVLEDREGKVVKAVSEVEEKDGKLWMASVLMPFMVVY